MSDKTYYSIRAISNSSLKWYEVSPRYFIAKYNDEISEPEMPHLGLGKKVHMAILEPDRFEDEFSCVDFDTPKSKNQQKFCETYVKELERTKNSEISASKAFSDNYNIKGKSEEKIAEEGLKLVNSLKRYIDYLEKQNKVDKKLINKKNKEIIQGGVLSIKNHKLASKLVVDDESNLFNKNIESFNELEITFKYPRKFDDYQLHCKSMLDRIIIDHENKVVKLVDIKTTYTIKDVNDFISNYKYYRQIAFYWIAVAEYFKEKYPDKTIEEYSTESYIVFVSTKDVYECKVVKIDENVLMYSLQEIDNIMSKLAWHFKNESWDYPIEYYDTEGYETFNLYNIKGSQNENGYN